MSKPRPKVLAKHVVKYLSHAVDQGDAKHGPQVIISLQIVEGKLAGERRTYYGSLNDGSQEFTAKAMVALGMTNDDLMAPEGLGSRKALAVERENLYPGAKYKSRIDFVDPIEAPKVKANNPVTNPSAMSSKFRALFKSIPKPEMHESVAAPDTVPEPTEAAESNDAPF